MRDFQFRSSPKKVTRAKNFAARVFGLRPMKRSSPTHTRKKTLVPSVERERQGRKAIDSSISVRVRRRPLSSAPT